MAFTLVQATESVHDEKYMRRPAENFTDQPRCLFKKEKYSDSYDLKTFWELGRVEISSPPPRIDFLLCIIRLPFGEIVDRERNKEKQWEWRDVKYQHSCNSNTDTSLQ